MNVFRQFYNRLTKTLSKTFNIPLEQEVLDETRALEESKRIELELLARQKLEGERRMHREHEATKVGWYYACYFEVAFEYAY